jgi:hypothetical protein
MTPCSVVVGHLWDWSSMSLRNVGVLPQHYTASQPTQMASTWNVTGVKASKLVYEHVAKVNQSLKWLGYGMDDRNFIPGRGSDFSLRHHAQTTSGVLQTHPKGTGGKAVEVCGCPLTSIGM